MAVLFNIKFKKSPKFSYWLEYGDRNYLTYKPTGTHVRLSIQFNL